MGPEPLRPIRRTYVSDSVTEQLENFIASNQLKEGDKLPSERELSAALHVGTRTIREALQRLETRGIIEVIHGKGSFVANRKVESYARHLVDSFRFLQSDEPKLLIELTDVRMIVEAAAIEEVARKRPVAMIAQLDGILADLSEARTAGDVDRYNSLDLLFHTTIVHAMENTLLSALYDHLRSLIARIFEGTGHITGAMDRSSKEHQAIFEAIRSGRPEAARAALVSHLSNTASDIKEVLRSP